MPAALIAAGLLAAAGSAPVPRASPPSGQGPSFACGAVAAGSIEALICRDRQLAGLDRQLAGVITAARTKAGRERPPSLQSGQQAWLQRRNACIASADQRSCAVRLYRQRIAELQARYRLVPVAGEGRFQCGSSPADELVATFFRTDPASLILERGDRTAFLLVQPSGSGARYGGQGVRFWEHQGTARLRWGAAAPELLCRRLP